MNSDNKIIISLKKYFSDAPTSQTQAHNICQNLERFQEVIFDIEGIPWASFNFMHELFVVYRKEHPKTKIIRCQYE